MNLKKAALLCYVRTIGALFGFKIGSVFPVRNLHYYLVTNVFKAYPVETHGHVMFLHLHDSIISSRLRWRGSFEPGETGFITAKVKDGDTVLDIGANIGYHTLTFARRVGANGRVFAFEPDPDNFALLKRNVELNGYRNVVLEQKAVSDRKGTLKLFIAEDNKGDHRTWDPHNGRKSIEIEAIALDDYFRDRQKKADFIKMDIQGAEGYALKGARGLFEHSAGLSGILEFWPKGLRDSGSDPKEVLELLAGYGYGLYEIKTGRPEPVTIDTLLSGYPPEADGEKEVFTNIFFCK